MEGFHSPSDPSSNSELGCCGLQICKSSVGLLAQIKIIHGRHSKILHLVKGPIKIVPLQHTQEIWPLALDQVASIIISQWVNISKLSGHKFYNHPFNNIIIPVQLRIIKEIDL